MPAENEVFVWIHFPVQPVKGRRKQSALARQLLWAACHVSECDLPESASEMPALELFDCVRRDSGIEVSIAHCPQMVAVTLARNRVGIDCEAAKPNRNWQGIADMFFSAEEAEAIRQAPTGEQEELFLCYWTVKEALIKAIRGDIWKDINAVVFQGSEVVVKNPELKNTRWNTWHGVVGGCALAICTENRSSPDFIFRQCRDFVDDGPSAVSVVTLRTEGTAKPSYLPRPPGL